MPLNNPTQMRPFRQVFKVKSSIVRFGEVIEIASVEIEEVHGCHGPD